MSARRDYVAALRVEAENLASRPDSPVVQRRIAEVNQQLGSYDANVTDPVVEVAVPGPITSARAKSSPKK